jgi:predicted enzyme related to lactoylglutathione lyase
LSVVNCYYITQGGNTHLNNSDTSGGRIGEIYDIVMDVYDLDRSAHFWSAVLGIKVANRQGQYLNFERQKGGLILCLQKVPEKKTSKNRMHLDIAVEDVNTASTHVKALGGRKLQDIEESGARCVVMADPVGNEFCLVNKADMTTFWDP